MAISVGLIGLTGCSQATTNDTTLLSNSTSDTGNADNPDSDATKSDNPNNVATTKPEPSTTSPTLETSEEVFYGQWVIKQVLAYGSAGTYSSEDATSLLDQSVNFSTDEASGFILFIKDDNTLIIYGGDTYFELVRKTT